MEIMLLIFLSGYFSQLIGSVILIKYIREKKTVEHLSVETQCMNFLGIIMRFIYTFDTRLSKLYLTWIELSLSIILNAYILFEFYIKRSLKTNSQNSFKAWKIIIPFCAILSYFFHPGEKNQYHFTVQMFVSCSMFIEAGSLLPQILHSKQEGFMDFKVGTYLVFMALSRVLRLIFWILQYLDGDQFIYLILADIIHTIIIGDFVILYFQHRRDKSNQLPI